MVGMIMKILRRGFFRGSWLVFFSGDGERVGGWGFFFLRRFFLDGGLVAW